MSDNIGFLPENQSQWPRLQAVPSLGHLLCQVQVSIYSVIFHSFFIAKYCQVSKLYCVWQVSQTPSGHPEICDWKVDLLEKWPASTGLFVILEWQVNQLNGNFITMPMLVHALAGSATYVLKRLRIKSALRTSFWLMTMLFSLMVLTAANGCFASPTKSHIISDVLLLKVNNTSKPEDGLLPVPSMNVRAPKVKWVNLTGSTNQVTKQATKWVTYSELRKYKRQAPVQ